MSKQLKNHITQDLERRFRGMEGYIVVDYRGLNSAQSYDLRRTLHGAGVRMSVVPNRLALRILDRWEGRRAEFRQFFRGPSAVLFGTDGPIAASRVVAQWKKKNKDLLTIKGGVLGGEIMPPRAVETLSRIPDRTQLLAQVAGSFQAPLSRLARAVQGPIQNLAYVLDAHRRKLEESGAGAPAGSEARGSDGTETEKADTGTAAEAAGGPETQETEA